MQHFCGANCHYSESYSDSIQTGCRGEFIRHEQAVEKANKFAPTEVSTFSVSNASERRYNMIFAIELCWATKYYMYIPPFFWIKIYYAT
jgi:hypothetical protein